MSRTPRPLLMTADPDLLDDLLRLASTVGVEAEVAHDPASARAGYAMAPLVLIGADQLRAGLRARLPRHSNVVLICRDSRDPEPWECAQSLGAAHVALLPDAEPWLLERLAETRDGRAGTGGKVVAILGGRGGAGASLLSAAMAITASRSRLRTLLVDGDPLGGGVDLLFGWEQVHGLRWPQLARANGNVEPAALVGALPGRGDLVLLSCGRTADDEDTAQSLSLPVEAMSAALDAGRRGRDLVVVDLPRRIDDATALALSSADRTLLIVPAELRAAAAAARVAESVLAHRTELSVVVRGPAPGNLGAAELATALGLPLAGQLRAEPRLAAAVERGEAPAADGKGPLANLCRQLIREVTQP